MKPIIILSGPVGAGKTTVARQLVAISPPPVVCIEGDIFWSFIAKGGEAYERNKNFRTIMVSMMAAAVPYALAGYEAIVDFSIPPWFLDTALAIVKLRQVPLDYVVLKPTEAVCARRAAARQEGTINDYKQYSEFYTTFAGFDEFTVHDSETDAPGLAKLIRKGLNAAKFRLPA
jgi:predicted kinase